MHSHQILPPSESYSALFFLTIDAGLTFVFTIELIFNIFVHRCVPIDGCRVMLLTIDGCRVMLLTIDALHDRAHIQHLCAQVRA